MDAGCELLNLKIEAGEESLRDPMNPEVEPETSNPSGIHVNKVFGIDPLAKTTIAGTALNIFRTVFMPKLEREGVTIAALSKARCEFIREAFFGGRTEVFVSYYETKEGEKIHYLDFTSLYSYINKYGIYPVGHPRTLKNPTVSDIRNPKGLGIYCVDVDCPQDLKTPCLPERIDGKLMYTLLSKKKKTFSNLELQVALRLGYTITKVHSGIHWDRTVVGLFKHYVNTMLQLKQQAAGWPSTCKSDEQKQLYIDEYFKKEGIKLDWSKIKDYKNKGLYAVAKDMLNSLWGKFGQRDLEFFTTTKIIHDNIEGNTTYYDQKSKDLIRDWTILNENSIVLTCKNKSDSPIINNTNVAIAVFTTCQARMKLYGLLETYGDRVLYCDTDSIVLLTRDGEPVPPLGSYLGDLTNELDDPDDYIVKFVAGGPKFYMYVTFKGQVETKCKGTNLKRGDVLSQINIERFEQICRGMYKQVVSFENITRKNYSVFTNSNTTKTLGGETLKKRIFNEDGTSRPWGEADRSELMATIERLNKSRNQNKPLIGKKRGRSEEQREGSNGEDEQKMSKKVKTLNKPEEFVVYMAKGRNVNCSKDIHIGMTGDLEERLKQHNGEGGLGQGGRTAGSDRAPTMWTLVATLGPFKTRSAALSFETGCKNVNLGLRSDITSSAFIASVDPLERKAMQFMYKAKEGKHSLKVYAKEYSKFFKFN